MSSETDIDANLKFKHAFIHSCLVPCTVGIFFSQPHVSIDTSQSCYFESDDVQLVGFERVLSRILAVAMSSTPA